VGRFTTGLTCDLVTNASPAETSAITAPICSGLSLRPNATTRAMAAAMNPETTAGSLRMIWDDLGHDDLLRDSWM